MRVAQPKTNSLAGTPPSPEALRADLSRQRER